MRFLRRINPLRNFTQRLPLAAPFAMLALASTHAHSQAAIPYTFRNVAIVAGGFITGIVPHPTAKGLTYLRTDIGGAYRWNADKQRWIPLTDWIDAANANLLGIESIGLDPTDPNKLYLSAGTYDQPWSPNGAILRSTDQGAHFDVVPVPFKMGGNQDGRQAGERLAVDPNAPATLFLGTRNDGLWKSTDSAKTWSPIASFPGKTANKIGSVFVLFDATSGSPGTPTPTLYAGISAPEDSLLRSTNAGQTWSPIPGGPTGLLPNHARLAPDGWLYLSYGDHPGPNGVTSGAVWKFNTKTSKWKDITPEIPGSNNNPTFGYGSLAVDNQVIMTATIDRWNKGDEIFRSTNGGVHWTAINPHAERDPAISPYIAGQDGKAAIGHWIGTIAIDPFDPNHALYGTGATVWATNDLQQVDRKKASHWFIGATGIEETAVITLISPPKGPNLISGLGDIGCFRNEDFNVSPRGGALKNPQFSNCDSIDYAASNPDLMVRTGRTWGGQSHGGLSTDNGATWNPFPTEPEGAKDGGNIALAADASVLIWTTRNKTLGESLDGGKHWLTTDKAPPHAEVVSDRVHPARFYLYDPGDAQDGKPNGTLYVADGPHINFAATALLVPKFGRIHATLGLADDLWITSNAGLWHASATAATPLLKLPAVQEAYALGFGAAIPPSASPTLFLSGKIDGAKGVYRSSDIGQTWQRLDDPEHHFGWIGVLSGDPRIPGRVYLGTNGRGVILGEPALGTSTASSTR